MNVQREALLLNSRKARYRNSPFSIINFQLSKSKVFQCDNDREQHCHP